MFIQEEFPGSEEPAGILKLRTKNNNDVVYLKELNGSGQARTAIVKGGSFLGPTIGKFVGKMQEPGEDRRRRLDQRPRHDEALLLPLLEEADAVDERRAEAEDPAARPRGAGRGGRPRRLRRWRLVVGGSISTSAEAEEIEDWPLFGRDRDNTRFATQDEVNTGNVDELGEAWSTELGPDQYLMESFPLVLGENVYVTTSTDEIMSIDGKTGHINWTYTPEVDFSQSTGVGGYGITSTAASPPKTASSSSSPSTTSCRRSARRPASASGPRRSKTRPPAPTSRWRRPPTTARSTSASPAPRTASAARSPPTTQKTGKKLWTFYTVPKAGDQVGAEGRRWRHHLHAADDRPEDRTRSTSAPATRRR